MYVTSSQPPLPPPPLSVPPLGPTQQKVGGCVPVLLVVGCSPVGVPPPRCRAVALRCLLHIVTSGHRRDNWCGHRSGPGCSWGSAPPWQSIPVRRARRLPRVGGRLPRGKFPGDSRISPSPKEPCSLPCLLLPAACALACCVCSLIRMCLYCLVCMWPK